MKPQPILIMEDTLERETSELSEAISPHAHRMSGHVRTLAQSLKEKTEATPFAADTLILANEVKVLCDYVEHLHGNVEVLLTKIETVENASDVSHHEITAEDRKAIEIQRETHELHPTLKDTIKALFMWRDSPEQRLRDDK